MKKLLLSFAVAVLAASLTFPTVAQDAKPAEKKAAPPARANVFRGKVAAVDKQAKTIKVGERTFNITSDSRIVKAGKPATLDDVATGEDVGGTYREGEDKKLNIVSLRVGPRPDAPKKEDAK